MSEGSAWWQVWQRTRRCDDLLDIADAFGFFVIGGESGDTQETGHGKGQEFLSHVYNSGC